MADEITNEQLDAALERRDRARALRADDARRQANERRQAARAAWLNRQTPRAKELIAQLSVYQRKHGLEPGVTFLPPERGLFLVRCSNGSANSAVSHEDALEKLAKALLT